MRTPHLLSLCLMCACASSIEDRVLDPSRDPGSGSGDGGAVSGPPSDVSADVPFVETDAGWVSGPDADGVYRVGVNATDYGRANPFDLDAGAFVEASEDWSLSFLRADVRLNGGVSGEADVHAALDFEDAFETHTQAPEEGWFTDAPDASGDGRPELALAGWYDYDITTHVLTPAAQTYFIKTAGGEFVKLRFTAYYDQAGTSGWPHFRYAAVDAPDSFGVGSGPSQRLIIDATSPSVPAYVDASNAILVYPDTPSNSEEWDLSFRQRVIRLNGGASGSGAAAAQRVDEPWDALSVAPSEGYAQDTASARVLDDWYDPATGAPRDHVYALQLETGGYAKLRILSYNAGGVEGAYRIELATLGGAP